MATSVKSALLGEQHAFHTPDRSSSFTLKTDKSSDGRRLDLVSFLGACLARQGPSVTAEDSQGLVCCTEATSISGVGLRAEGLDVFT
jgi:hypothetical protein